MHGAYHTEESNRLVQELLESEGIPAHSVRLPSARVFKTRGQAYTYWKDASPDITVMVNDKPEVFTTFNDYASKIAHDIVKKEFRRVIVAGQSLGGDPAPRVPYMLGRKAHVEELAFFSSPLHAATVAGFRKRSFPDFWNKKELDMNGIERNTQQYLDGILPYRNINRSFGVPDGEWGLTDYDRARAPEVFYNCCSPEIAAAATSQLRMQWRAFSEPALLRWPDIDSVFYFGEFDRVTTEPWCRARAEMIGADFITIEGADHSMQLSQPEETAEHLLQQVRRSY